MTSQTKINANRKNAKKSTGPNTKLGKQRSKINATKHGLASPIISGSLEDDIVKCLAEAISCHSGAGPLTTTMARDVAEAEFVIRKARMLRTTYFEQYGFYPDCDMDQFITHLEQIDRYDRRARSKRKRGLKQLF